MSVTNGQQASANTFNSAFLSRTTDSDTVGVVGLNNTSDPNSGAQIVNTQRLQNELADADGVAGEGDVNAKVYSSNNIIADGDDRKVAIGKLDNRFDGTIGHNHNGSTGEGPQLSASDLTDLNYYRAVWQTFTVTGAAGTDDDVSTPLTGKTPGGATAVAGVITAPPYNKVELRDSSLGTYLEDAGGQRIYGRITESAGVWTLTYYTNEAGVETATTLSATDIRVYFLEVFTLDTVPTIPDDAGFIGSLDLTADIVDASATQRGVVSTGSQTLGGLKTLGDGAIVEDHWATPRADVASTATINALTYNPFVKITGATATQVNGIASGTDGKRLVLHNGSSQTLTVAHEDASATSANRIKLPQAKNVTLKPDGSAVFIYDTGQSRWVLQTSVGSGSGTGSGSGGVNLGALAELNIDAEVNVNDWTGFDDAGASYVNGTGGTAPDFVLSRTTSVGEVLNGLASFKLAKAASNAQGQGWSFDVPVPLGYAGQPAKLNFPLKVSANYAPGDVEMYVFDVTNSRILVPLPNSIDLPGGQKDLIQQFFYIPYDCEDLRVSFFVASTSALAYDMFFDDFGVLAITALEAGPTLTDQQSYTPTFTGFGTPTSVEFVWGQEADCMFVYGKFVSGTTTATEARISLPNGYLSAGTDKIPSLRMVGRGTFSSAGNFDGNVLIEPSVGYMTFGTQDATQSGLTKQNGDVLMSPGVTFSFFAKIPILGFSSGSTSVIDLPTKKVIADVQRAAAQTISDSTDTTVIFQTVNEDTDGQYDDTTGVFTCKYPGDFEVSANALFDPNTTGYRTIEVWRNGAIFRRLKQKNGDSTIGTMVGGTTVVPGCVAGDTLEVTVFQSSGGALNIGSGAAFNYATFTRVNDRTQITPATECSVEARLTADTPFGANTPIIFDDVLEDLTGSYDNTTGVFTCKIPGKYWYEPILQTNTGTGDGLYVVTPTRSAYLSSFQSNGEIRGAGISLRLNIGDTVVVQSTQAKTFTGISGGIDVCSFSIYKYGN